MTGEISITANELKKILSEYYHVNAYSIDISQRTNDSIIEYEGKIIMKISKPPETMITIKF